MPKYTKKWKQYIGEKPRTIMTSLRMNLVFSQIQNNLNPGTGHLNQKSHILERTNLSNYINSIKMYLISLEPSIRHPGNPL